MSIFAFSNFDFTDLYIVRVFTYSKIKFLGKVSYYLGGFFICKSLKSFGAYVSTTFYR